jgi:hypothetical protein
MRDTIPKTYQQAIDEGWEPATEEEFRAALKAMQESGAMSQDSEKVDCSTAPDGTRCLYVPCFNGLEFISTCLNGICQPALKNRC